MLQRPFVRPSRALRCCWASRAGGANEPGCGATDGFISLPGRDLGPVSEWRLPHGGSSPPSWPGLCMKHRCQVGIRFGALRNRVLGCGGEAGTGGGGCSGRLGQSAMVVEARSRGRPGAVGRVDPHVCPWGGSGERALGPANTWVDVGGDLGGRIGASGVGVVDIRIARGQAEDALAEQLHDGEPNCASMPASDVRSPPSRPATPGLACRRSSSACR